MFFYDVFGILFLVLIGGFSLFLPLVACALLVWVFGKLRSRMVHHGRFSCFQDCSGTRRWPSAHPQCRESSQLDLALGFRKAHILVALALACFCGRALAEERSAADPLEAQVGSPSTPVFQALQAPSSHQKFRYAVRHSILSPRAYLIGAAGAGFSMAADFSGDRDYGMGAEGFSRRWADRVGKATVTEFAGSWVAASLLRQDPEYYPSPNPAFIGRAAYAVSRVFVTRGDNGHSQFNASNMAGIATGVAASLAWNPARPFTTGRFFHVLGDSIAVNGIVKMTKEFLRKRKRP